MRRSGSAPVGEPARRRRAGRCPRFSDAPGRPRRAAGYRSLLLLGVLAASLRVSAASPVRVVVLPPATPTPREHELSARLEGELVATGFEVVERSAVRRGDDRDSGRGELDRPQPIAEFTLGEQRAAASALRAGTLWLVLAEPGREMVRLVSDPVHTGSPRAAALLAVQGVELLRAHVADWRQRVPSVLPGDAIPVRQRRETRIDASLALGLLLQSGTGPAPTPLLRLDVLHGAALDATSGPALRWGLSATIAGFAAHAVLRRPGRSVEVGQSFAALEAVAALEAGRWFEPFVALGGGVYRLSIDGIGGDGLVGRHQTTLSAAGMLSAGLVLRGAGPWLGRLDARGVFALHPTEVRIDERAAASLGVPAVILSLGAGVSL
jgi:hypothetical protein